MELQDQLRKRHLEAKHDINLVTTLLYAEDKISKETKEFIERRLERIEDNPFSLLGDLLSETSDDRVIEMSCGKEVKRYKVIEV